MNNILIVDDEPIIVEGLFRLLNDLDTLELNVWKAHSAEQAIEVMRNNRIDILMTDIQMSGINGLELAEKVKEHWSFCKIIFITGYSNPEYMLFALHKGISDYLMKPVEDEKVIEVVGKVISDIERDWMDHSIVEKAKSQVQQALPLLQREFFVRLLKGHMTDGKLLDEQLQALDIPLRPTSDLMIMIARVDRWPESQSIKDEELLKRSLYNIVEEYLLPYCQAVSTNADDIYFVLLLQNRSMADNFKYIQEMVEKIQSTIRRVLHISCSIALSQSGVSWSGLHETYAEMRELFKKGIGLDEEMIIIDHRHDLAGPDVSAQVAQSRHYKDAADRLRLLLEAGDYTTFTAKLTELLHVMQTPVYVEYSLQLEVFCTLSALFLSFMNTRQMVFDVGRKIDLEKLSSYRDHTNWAALTSYFIELSGLVVQHAEVERTSQKKNIVDRIDEYIRAHLDGDLSLYQLATSVNLSPSYLSRMYQKEKRRSLSMEIAECRINRAKALLANPDIRIQDIAVEVGFKDNIPYFTKFFKMHAGMSPKTYRECNK